MGHSVIRSKALKPKTLPTIEVKMLDNAIEVARTVAEVTTAGEQEHQRSRSQPLIVTLQLAKLRAVSCPRWRPLALYLARPQV